MGYSRSLKDAKRGEKPKMKDSELAFKAIKQLFKGGSPVTPKKGR